MIDLKVFEGMKLTAEKALRTTEFGTYTQAIVLVTNTEKAYHAVIKDALSEKKTDEAALIQEMQTAGNTKIRHILCMWYDGGIDFPSFAFREMLLAMDPENSEASMFVTTLDGVSEIKMHATMP